MKSYQDVFFEKTNCKFVDDSNTQDNFTYGKTYKVVSLQEEEDGEYITCINDQSEEETLSIDFFDVTFPETLL